MIDGKILVKPRNNHIGMRFGNLLVQEQIADYIVPGNGERMARYQCKCACGKKVDVNLTNLSSGRTKNCRACGGKLRSKTSRTFLHGKTNTPTFITWQAMKQRCMDENHSSYPRYGGRDIKVCDRWLNSFENFLEDMGERPSKNHSIDRIDVDGNYEPSNCRWVYKDKKGNDIQANNRRSNVYLTFKGKTQTISMWAREIGIDRGTIQRRLNKGLSTGESLGFTKRLTESQILASYIKGLQAKGLISNQARLARDLGLSKSTISKILSGTRHADVEPDMSA